MKKQENNSIKNVTNEELVFALDEGSIMHNLARDMWPICRSITGEGIRKTIRILSNRLPNLKSYEIPTGTKCFDWVVPKEWNISSAFIEDKNKVRIIDFSDNNLHVVNYSHPIDKVMKTNDLKRRLFSLPGQPDAIPYVTSYYKEFWGFCMSENQKILMTDEYYRVKIDSELKDGCLNFADLVIKGRSEEEILFSTYICHPSMANNELSGPVLATSLATWLSGRDNHYTYRFVFVPETIGAICYLSKNINLMKERTRAGFILTCVGDERAWSFMPSRYGDTLSDRAALNVLDNFAQEYKAYTFLERGSDERQYCSPGVDLPVCSIMRSKYMTYPEYHTSLDNLEFVTPKGLGESYLMYRKLIETLEANCFPASKILCEPKMSDRGLRPTLGKKGSALSTMMMMNLITYSDGKKDLIDIANILGTSVINLKLILDELVKANILDVR